MAEETPRFKIPYPSNHEQPFYTPFEAGFLASDALHFAHFEQGNIQIFGGGTIGWNSSAEFSFSADIVFSSPTFGQQETWDSGESPITIPSGNFLVASVTRGTTTSVALTKSGGTPTIIVTSSVPISAQSVVLAYHEPNSGDLILFNGIRIAQGGSGSLAPAAAPPTAFVGVLVDSRGSPLVTPSVSAGGGTHDFTISVGQAYAVMNLLRVASNGGLSDDMTLQFFRDAARTDEIYNSGSQDPSTQYSDRTPATLIGDSGAALASDTLYGRITNDALAASTFNIEVVLWGPQT